MKYYLLKKNKYGAINQTYKNTSYHSKLEAKYAAELDLRLRAKDIKSWNRQVRISLTAHGKHICNYYIDFVIEHNDGTMEYVEVKGFDTNVWRLKWKMFEAQMAAEQPMAKLTIAR